MVWPAARSSARQRQISSRISGARPSVASSRISSRGLVTSARPIASICCSPPDSWLPRLSRRSARRGNRRYTRAAFQGSPPALPPRRAANAVRCSSTDRFGKTCRPSGTIPSPSRAMRSGARPRTSRPSKLTLPAREPTSPRMERTSVVLPMPLRPSSPTTSPPRMSRSTPNSTWLAPYAVSRPCTRSSGAAADPSAGWVMRPPRRRGTRRSPRGRCAPRRARRRRSRVR